jgi:5-methylcytosine-specific restriction endonuclease McrA
MSPPRPTGHALRQLRALVVARDGAVCARCGMTIDTGLSGNHPRGLTLGHAWDRAKGGPDDASNLRPEHRACNGAGYPPTALTRPLHRA